MQGTYYFSAVVPVFTMRVSFRPACVFAQSEMTFILTTTKVAGFTRNLPCIQDRKRLVIMLSPQPAKTNAFGEIL